MYRLAVTLLLALAACHNHSHDEAFATFAACYEDHTVGDEMLAKPEAIVACCLDHPVEGLTDCGPTAAACETLMQAELDDAVAADADIMAGCADYIVQKGM